MNGNEDENLTKFYQGKFKPKNRHKYKGDYTNIIYRSSWEFTFLNQCDLNNNIICYSSEEIVIPYRDPVTGKRHRYFVDFWVKTQEGKEFLIEVKPYNQTLPPNIPNKKSRRFLNEVATWGKNLGKWKAAIEFSEHRGMQFKILTEKGEVDHWKQFLL